jgi:hypothetical protein
MCEQGKQRRLVFPSPELMIEIITNENILRIHCLRNEVLWIDQNDFIPRKFCKSVRRNISCVLIQDSQKAFLPYDIISVAKKKVFSTW